MTFSHFHQGSKVGSRDNHLHHWGRDLSRSRVWALLRRSRAFTRISSSCFPCRRATRGGRKPPLRIKYPPCGGSTNSIVISVLVSYCCDQNWLESTHNDLLTRSKGMLLNCWGMSQMSICVRYPWILSDVTGNWNWGSQCYNLTCAHQMSASVLSTGTAAWQTIVQLRTRSSLTLSVEFERVETMLER